MIVKKLTKLLRGFLHICTNKITQKKTQLYRQSRQACFVILCYQCTQQHVHLYNVEGGEDTNELAESLCPSDGKPDDFRIQELICGQAELSSVAKS